MKIRNGFVSNSSTSSFCIYGTKINSDFKFSDEVLKEFIDKNYDGVLEEVVDMEYFLDDIRDEIFYNLVKKIGIEYHNTYESEYGFLGLSYTELKDDETGKEFRDRATALVRMIIPDAKCEHIEESWSH